MNSLDVLQVEGLDQDFLSYIDTLHPSLREILLTAFSELKGRIGMDTLKNERSNYESTSDGRRYRKLLGLFTADVDGSYPEGLVDLLNTRELNLVDACAGNQTALRDFILALNGLISAGKTAVKKVELYVYDKNMDPSMLISRYDVPRASFELVKSERKDAKTEYHFQNPHPTMTIISYSDLYNSQLDYAKMINSALIASNIVVVIPGKFSLKDDEVVPLIIYKERGSGEFKYHYLY
jgi:hypothetical protein